MLKFIEEYAKTKNQPWPNPMQIALWGEVVGANEARLTEEAKNVPF